MTSEAHFDLLLLVPDEQRRMILADWNWLLIRTGKQYEPIAMTLFGQWFLEASTGEVDYLDILDGDLITVAESRRGLDRLLKTQEGRELLMADLCELLWSRGLRPGPGQCYGYKVPPVLGASVTSENVEVNSIRLLVSLQGQLLKQLADKNEGVPVTRFVVKSTGDA